MLLFQLLFLMFSLIMIGEPFRVLISRSLSFFRELDVLQACVIDVYLGGLFLYAIALVPLCLFTTYIVWGITVLFAFFSFFSHRELLRKFKFLFHFSQKRGYVYAFWNEHKIHVLKSIAVFGMFLFSLWIQLMPLSNLVFGSIHDTSLHALFTELILENGHIPATHQPYLSAAIIYPQGAHVIFAYSCYILQIIPAKAIFYVSPLFSAMTTLAAYSLGKKMNPVGNLDIIFAFVMTFVSMWPMYITWGSNPFILGFALYLFCLGILPCLYDLHHSGIQKLFVIGILYGYSASIHLAFYELLIASAMLWLFVEVARKPEKTCKIGIFLIMCIFSVVPVAPFLCKYIQYYTYPGQNIGLPGDIVADVKSIPCPNPDPSNPPLVSILTNFPMELFSNYNIHPYLPLRALWIGLGFASVLTLFFFIRKNPALCVAGKIASITLGAGILLDISTFILPAIPWGRISIILYISICLLIAVFTIQLYSTLRMFSFRVFHIVTRNRQRTVVISCMTSLLMVSALFAPFVYYTILSNPENLRNVYGTFAVTTDSDYEVMRWMKHNLYDNAVILISPYECGGFIPSISQKKAVFPLSAYWLSYSYRRIVDLIRRRVINETVYELMNDFEITHIFVGCHALQYWGKVRVDNPKWDPLLFLGNPNFEILKNTGGSYLFAVSRSNSSIVFQEDFEYLSLTQMGWRFSEIENGHHNLTIVQDESGNHLLRMLAERNETSRWLYSCWLNRKVYLWDSPNANLSFHLNASSVKTPNAVSISVFDADRQHYIMFATPSVFYNNQTRVTELQSSCGAFSYNISDIWERTYDELLPNVIIIELALVNVDNSSPTDVFFDNITITVN